MEKLALFNILLVGITCLSWEVSALDKGILLGVMFVNLLSLTIGVKWKN